MQDLFSLSWLYSSPLIRCFKTKEHNAVIEYFVFGKNPQLLISSGIHGDECQTISSVSKAIQNNLVRLPSFIYIPIAAPSAVRKQTRINDRGQDVNRGFLDNSQVDESKAIMNIIGSHTFNLNVSFHEDPGLAEFYVYDNLSKNEKRDISPIYKQFKQTLIGIGIDLFNGIDDPTDPDLGYMFSDGYAAITYADSHKKEDGQLETWITQHNISLRSFNPEIPGTFEQKQKDELVEAIFAELIVPFIRL